ncbi:8824_t:CDS:2, partial [Scutellospora calospora]
MAIKDPNSSAEPDTTPTLFNSQTDKQNSDKEIKMETDFSNMVTTSKLEENISNTEKAET